MLIVFCSIRSLSLTHSLSPSVLVKYFKIIKTLVSISLSLFFSLFLSFFLSFPPCFVLQSNVGKVVLAVAVVTFTTWSGVYLACYCNELLFWLIFFAKKTNLHLEFVFFLPQTDCPPTASAFISCNNQVSECTISTEENQADRSKYEKFVDDVEEMLNTVVISSSSSESSLSETTDRVAINDSILGDPETDRLLVPPCPGSVTGSSGQGEDNSSDDDTSTSEDESVQSKDSEAEDLPHTGQVASANNVQGGLNNDIIFMGHSDGSKPLLHDDEDEECDDQSTAGGMLRVRVSIETRMDSVNEMDLDAEVERNLLPQIVRDSRPDDSKDLFGSQPFDDEAVCVLEAPRMPEATRFEDLFGATPFSGQSTTTTATVFDTPVQESNSCHLQQNASAIVLNPPVTSTSNSMHKVKSSPSALIGNKKASAPTSTLTSSTAPTTAATVTTATATTVSSTTTATSTTPASSASPLAEHPPSKPVICIKSKVTSIDVSSSVSTGAKDHFKKKNKEKEAKLKSHVTSKLTGKGKTFKLDEDDDDADGLIADEEEDATTCLSSKVHVVDESGKDVKKEKKKDKKDKEKKDKREDKRLKVEKKKEDKKKEDKKHHQRDKSRDGKKESKSKSSSVGPDVGSVGGFANMSFEDASEESTDIRL